MMKLKYFLLAMALSACANTPKEQNQNGEFFFQQATEAEERADFKQSFELYKKSCDSNYYKACYMLSSFYASGAFDTPKDISKSISLQEKACHGNYAQSCATLGLLYRNGSIIPRDYTNAKKYFQKACDLGHQESCNDYENLVNGKFDTMLKAIESAKKNGKLEKLKETLKNK